MLAFGRERAWRMGGRFRLMSTADCIDGMRPSEAVARNLPRHVHIRAACNPQDIESSTGRAPPRIEIRAGRFYLGATGRRCASPAASLSFLDGGTPHPAPYPRRFRPHRPDLDPVCLIVKIVPAHASLLRVRGTAGGCIGILWRAHTHTANSTSPSDLDHERPCMRSFENGLRYVTLPIESIR